MRRYSPAMRFLVVYSRSRRELLSLEQFESADSQVAALTEREASNIDPDIEVVALRSTSFEALKVTHGRYFVRAPENLRPVAR